MSTDFRAFFQHTDRDILSGMSRELFQPNGTGEPRRPCADNNYIIFHDISVGAGWLGHVHEPYMQNVNLGQFRILPEKGLKNACNYNKVIF